MKTYESGGGIGSVIIVIRPEGLLRNRAGNEIGLQRVEAITFEGQLSREALLIVVDLVALAGVVAAFVGQRFTIISRCR